MRVQFSVPGRPSRWQRPGQDNRDGGKGRRFTDKKAEAGKFNIAQHAARALHAAGWPGPTTGPVRLTVQAIFHVPKSWPPKVRAAAIAAGVDHVADPDLDQLVKQVKDAMRGLAYEDDNQVSRYGQGTRKRYGDPERTEIVLETIPQAEAAVTPGQRRLEGRPPIPAHKGGWRDTGQLSRSEYLALQRSLKARR